MEIVRQIQNSCRQQPVFMTVAAAGLIAMVSSYWQGPNTYVNMNGGYTEKPMSSVPLGGIHRYLVSAGDPWKTVAVVVVFLVYFLERGLGQRQLELDENPDDPPALPDFIIQRVVRRTDTYTQTDDRTNAQHRTVHVIQPEVQRRDQFTQTQSRTAYPNSRQSNTTNNLSQGRFHTNTSRENSLHNGITVSPSPERIQRGDRGPRNGEQRKASKRSKRPGKAKHSFNGKYTTGPNILHPNMSQPNTSNMTEPEETNGRNALQSSNQHYITEPEAIMGPSVTESRSPELVKGEHSRRPRPKPHQQKQHDSCTRPGDLAHSSNGEYLLPQGGDTCTTDNLSGNIISEKISTIMKERNEICDDHDRAFSEPTQPLAHGMRASECPERHRRLSNSEQTKPKYPTNSQDMAYFSHAVGTTTKSDGSVGFKETSKHATSNDLSEERVRLPSKGDSLRSKNSISKNYRRERPMEERMNTKSHSPQPYQGLISYLSENHVDRNDDCVEAFSIPTMLPSQQSSEHYYNNPIRRSLDDLGLDERHRPLDTNSTPLGENLQPFESRQMNASVTHHFLRIYDVTGERPYSSEFTAINPPSENPSPTQFMRTRRDATLHKSGKAKED